MIGRVADPDLRFGNGPLGPALGMAIVAPSQFLGFLGESGLAALPA